MRNETKNIFFILLFFVCFLTGCGEIETVRDILTLEDIKTGALENDWLVKEPEECFESISHSTFAYDRLTEAEKIWYRDINKMLSARSETGVKLSKEGFEQGLTQENIDKIYNCVMIDHPEYFYVEGYEYTQYSIQDKMLGIKICGKYDIDLVECKRRRTQIETAVAEILKQAPVQGSDYDKIRFVYEYIILQTEYDLTAADNQNIYSVFCAKTSVCQGYAKAAQYLLNQMGVECTLVFGLVEENEFHSWNLVQSGEDYYYMDTTWGDASYTSDGKVLEGEEAPDINYDYLCITSKQLFKTHSLFHDVELPECTAMEDNYYVREGCYIYEYDEEQIDREFEEVLLSGADCVTLKCDTEELYELIYNEMVTQQKVFEYLEPEMKTVRYIVDKEQQTLTFWVTK